MILQGPIGLTEHETYQLHSFFTLAATIYTFALCKYES